MSWLSTLVTLIVAVLGTDGFATTNHASSLHRAALASQSSLSMAESSSETKKTTLTDETKWRLRLLLNDVTTTQGRKLNGQLFVLEGNFIEEEGYEPPQGTFEQLRRFDSDDSVEGGKALEISKSRWKLSEDPDDPKDGLWIWGLFKEPLYPFMLLQVETKELELSNDSENKDSIPPLKLYAQISHIRNDDVGVELKTSNLNVRVLERVQLPGASVDLYEEEAVGQVSFQSL